MPRPITVVLTIMDRKGEQAQTLIHVENQDTASLADLLEAARLHQVNVDACATGQIIACGLVVDVPLDSGLKSTPAVEADVEEGAKFFFDTDDSAVASFFVPTFDQDKIQIGVADVDLTDPDVDDLVTDILGGYDGVEVQDYRGSALTALRAARQDFHRSRV